MRETRTIKHEQGKINMHGPEIEIFQSSQLDTDMIRLVFGVKKLMKGEDERWVETTIRVECSNIGINEERTLNFGILNFKSNFFPTFYDPEYY